MRPVELGYQTGLPWSVVTANWSAAGGYYVHQGRVYLQGKVSSPGAVGQTVGATIATGLPAELRPASPVTVSVPALHAEYATPGIDLPDTVDIVVGSDGTLALASLPPFINAVPDPTATYAGASDAPVPYFTKPVAYVLVLANASWPVRAGSGTAPPWEDLAPYLGDRFENIDGEIRLWNARIELRGRVKALSSIANSRWFATEPESGELLSGYRNFPLLINLPARYTQAIGDGDAVTISGPGWEATALFSQGTDGGLGPDGALVDPSDGAPGWKLYVLSDGKLLGVIGNRSDGEHSDLTVITLPMNDDVGDLAVLFDPARAFEGNNLWAPVVEASQLSGGGVDNPYSQWTIGNPGGTPGDPLGMSNVGGLHSHAGDHYPGEKRSSTTRYSWLLAQHDEPIAANSSGTVTLPVADVVSPYLDVFDQPDWCALVVCALGLVSGGAAAVTIDSVHLLASGSFLLLDDQGAVVSKDSPDNGPSAIGGLSNNLGSIAAWVAPNTPSYPYDPNNPASALLWRPSDLPRSFGATLDWTSGTPFFAPQWAEARLYLFPVPLWETRRQFIVKNDVLTLDGGGWQNLYLPPTTIFPGPGSSAAIPKGLITGTQGSGATVRPGASAAGTATDPTFVAAALEPAKVGALKRPTT